MRRVLSPRLTSIADTILHTRRSQYCDTSNRGPHSNSSNHTGRRMTMKAITRLSIAAGCLASLLLVGVVIDVCSFLF